MNFDLKIFQLYLKNSYIQYQAIFVLYLFFEIANSREKKSKNNVIFILWRKPDIL